MADNAGTGGLQAETPQMDNSALQGGVADTMLQGGVQESVLTGAVSQDFTPQDPGPGAYCPRLPKVPNLKALVPTADNPTPSKPAPKYTGSVVDTSNAPLQGRADKPAPPPPKPETPSSETGPPLRPEIPILDTPPPSVATSKSPKKWDLNAVREILCKIDRSVMADLADTDVVAVDGITWDDYIFKGGKWVQDRPGGLGGWNGSELVILAGMTPEQALDTLYHELLHKHQPPTMDWSEKELLAYTETEMWLIKHGLPGSYHKAGDKVPNLKQIQKQVASYPTKPGPRPVDKDLVHNRTLWYDPATETTHWQPSKEGDHVPGNEIRIGERKIPRTEWKCP